MGVVESVTVKVVCGVFRSSQRSATDRAGRYDIEL
jgi:hypothetical protein